jgi:hemerythrin-like domain-containing protein
MATTTGLDGLLGAPAPGPEDPIGMLRACHGRMLEHCALLERLVAHLDGPGQDAQTTSAAARIQRYFDTAALDHHQDEEQDLFPMLAKLETARELIRQLKAMHPELETQWRGLKPLMDALVRDKEIDLKELQARSGRFVSAFRDHIDQENTQLLPLAEQALSASQKRTLGERMAARRGIDFK